MRALAPIAALSLAACGGLAADVEIERFCYSQSLPVAGTVTPVNLPPGSPLGATIDLPLPPLLRAKGEATVRIEDATITTATADLSGIQSLSVQEQAAGTLASYTRPSPFTTPIRTIVAAGQGANVAQAVTAGSLRLQLRVAGTPPTGDWTADVTVCAYGKSKINYF